MQKSPNPEFYLCPTCNNQIRSQNKLMHEARCEFLRKNQRSQPQIQQIPVNLHPNTNQINGNFNLDRNPSISQYQNIPPRQNNQLYNLSYDPRPNLPINNLNPNNFNNSRQNLNEPNLIPSTNRSTCTHCQKSFLQDRLAEHELLCPITFEKCPHCFYEYPRNFLPTHFNSCPGLLTLCPVCNDEYPLEILQDHINANHLPTPENPNDKKRESSPSFFDKLKNIFSSNDKKDKIKFVKCDKCNKNISLTIYESHIKECKRPIPPPARNSDNQLFSLMMRPQNGNRMIIRQTSRNAALTNEMNELDAEARKMRELMLLMQLLLAQKPTEEKGMKDQEINDNSIICKFEAEKNAGLNEDYKKCSICQCDFENDEDIRIFVCLHRYHKDCADAWLKKKTWCPLCRKSVRSGQEERKEEEEENI